MVGRPKMVIEIEHTKYTIWLECSWCGGVWHKRSGRKITNAEMKMLGAPPLHYKGPKRFTPCPDPVKFLHDYFQTYLASLNRIAMDDFVPPGLKKITPCKNPEEFVRKFYKKHRALMSKLAWD